MKTSNSSWKKQLDLILSQVARKRSQSKPGEGRLRLAVVGIGSELNGDDAAGVQVARTLILTAGKPADFLALDGGSIPENTSGPLRRFQPDLVILVDAADMESTPGTVRWLVKDQINGMSASSHTLPLSVLGGFLEEELECRVEYLGIQPGQLEFGADLSPEVMKSVEGISLTLSKQMIIRNADNQNSLETD
jgi:hydrogenase 3 maturation protease